MYARVRDDQPSPTSGREVRPLLRDDDFDRRPTPLWQLPDPKVATAGIAQVLIDVLVGQRPVSQLNSVTTAPVRADILRTVASLPAQTRTTRVRLQVVSVRVTTPGPTVVEASAVIRGTQRSRAMAMRLEGLDGRWLCTALTVG